MSKTSPALTAGGVPLALWLGYWRAMARYHRYEVEGIERLDGPGGALIVGYHGRPVAWDLCMLSTRIHERAGYLPHGVFHGFFGHNPALRWFIDGLGAVSGDDERLGDVLARGEHLIVLPGGTREGLRSFRHRYEVDWGQRTGYVRLAARLGVPIVPVGASGVDGAFIGLNDGYRLGKALGVPHRIPVWFGVGPTGLWPLSPPWPVKVRQVIGEPVTETAGGRVDPDDRERLLAIHEEVVRRVRGLLDEARRR